MIEVVNELSCTLGGDFFIVVAREEVTAVGLIVVLQDLSDPSTRPSFVLSSDDV